MPGPGVYVFDVIAELCIQPRWVQAALGISQQRYGRLKRGVVLFTDEEVTILANAMERTYGVGLARLFGPDAEILPAGRKRRAKGARTAAA